MNTPRIYVASLADYNAGHLLGVWIDATDEPAEIWKQINAMLKRSRYPNVTRRDWVCSCGHEWISTAPTDVEECPECGEDKEVTCSDPYASAEEWAIHDHEHLDGIGEYGDIETIHRVACGIEQHGEAFALYCSDVLGWHYVGEDVIEGFEDAYLGVFDSERAYAEHVIDSGCFGEIPAHLENYIDTEKLGRDLLMDLSTARGSEGLHVYQL